MILRWLAGFVTFIALAPVRSVAEPTVQVHADFSEDPSWENRSNRVVARDPPLVTQDFGWSPGKIGGPIWDSTTPAWYATPLARPLSFNERFGANGKFRFPPGKAEGNAYIGFFNHQRQEWRPWSSVAVRLWADGKFVRPGVDYMTAKWGAMGYETDLELPMDGTEHTWQLSYDPNEAAPAEFPDPKLYEYLLGSRQTAKQIFETARGHEPGVTQAEIDRRLSAVLGAGVANYFHRGQNFWTRYDEVKGARGAITLRIDGGIPYKSFILPEHRAQPIVLDRFGIFNLQMYHKQFELYITELAVNGTKIDLAHDPRWEGQGNRDNFRETDFQRQDFGYSATNWAGEKLGEIGGTFYRVEPIDPLHGYYADNIGKLTLDDPISFSGTVCFTRGATDAGMFIGYFNSESQSIEISDPKNAPRMTGLLGINIEGPTRVGYYFSPVCSMGAKGGNKDGPVFLPDRQRHKFSFVYDPAANDGLGQIVMKLDDRETRMKLKPGEKQRGVKLDHFGLLSVRSGGKYVTVYFDDLTYTTRERRANDPVRHQQEITVVPYPPGGRKY